MIAAEPRLEGEGRIRRVGGLARSYREGRRPTVRGFSVDEQPPCETFAAWKRECSEVDSEWDPQFTTGRDSRRSASFELPVQADRFVSDHDRMSVLVGEIETPLMFDVCLIPRNPDSNGNGDLLGAGSDDTEPTSENEQFPIADLYRIGHQNDGAKSWRVEHEVGLIHCVDPSGLVQLTGTCP